MVLIRTRGDLANGGGLIPRNSRDTAQKYQGRQASNGFSQSRQTGDVHLPSYGFALYDVAGGGCAKPGAELSRKHDLSSRPRPRNIVAPGRRSTVGFVASMHALGE